MQIKNRIINKQEFIVKTKKSIDDIFSKIDELKGKRDKINADANDKSDELVVTTEV